MQWKHKSLPPLIHNFSFSSKAGFIRECGDVCSLTLSVVYLIILKGVYTE